MSDMLENDFNWYLQNQSTLVEKYSGKYLVIVNQSVVSSHDSLGEAYFEALKNYKIGTFLVQLCQPGEESYSQSFHSRVSFS